MRIDLYDSVADKVAADFEMDSALVKAIIEVESGGNRYKVRYEPSYRWMMPQEIIRKFASRNNISYDTEYILQKMSHGLMQVMGGVCREMGMLGLITTMYEPEIAIHYGCAQLMRLMKKWDKMEDVIASYNAGTVTKNQNGEYVNQDYVDKVLKVYQQIHLGH